MNLSFMILVETIRLCLQVNFEVAGLSFCPSITMQAADAVAASLGNSVHVNDLRIGESYALYTDSLRADGATEFTRKDDGLVSHDALPLSLNAEWEPAFVAGLAADAWSPEFIMSKVIATKRQADTACYNALLAGPDGAQFEVHIQKIAHAAAELVANNTSTWQRCPQYRRALLRMLQPAPARTLSAPSPDQASSDAWFELQLRAMDPCKTRDSLQRLVLESPNNPARLASLISVLGNALTEKRLATMFPVVFCSATATDPMIFGSLSASKRAATACSTTTPNTRVEILVTEKLGITMEEWWVTQATAGELSWDIVLCDIMQVLCNLVSAQKHLGMVLDTCTVGTIRSKPVTTNQAIHITWNDRAYRVATAGNCWKWTDFSEGSVLFGGTRLVSLNNLSLWEKMNIPLQRDLVQFACSAYKTLDALRSRIRTVVDGVSEEHVMRMLNDWTVCRYAYWEPNTSTRDATIELMKLEEKTCNGLQSQACMHAMLADVGAALTCTNALPHLQSGHFNSLLARNTHGGQGADIEFIV
jgi:hypothetical protein